jgi:hypothetical protein
MLVLHVVEIRQHIRTPMQIGRMNLAVALHMKTMARTFMGRQPIEFKF